MGALPLGKGRSNPGVEAEGRDIWHSYRGQVCEPKDSKVYVSCKWALKLVIAIACPRGVVGVVVIWGLHRVNGFLNVMIV